MSKVQKLAMFKAEMEALKRAVSAISEAFEDEEISEHLHSVNFEDFFPMSVDEWEYHLDDQYCAIEAQLDDLINKIN